MLSRSCIHQDMQSQYSYFGNHLVFTLLAAAREFCTIAAPTTHSEAHRSV